MQEFGDFEIVSSSRRPLAGRASSSNGLDNLADAAANNFDRILDIASAMVEIQKIQTQANACIGMLREKRLLLEAETEAYVNRIRAETDATVNKAEVIRRMMQDYYSIGRHSLTGDEFSQIISDVLNHMGEI